MNHIEGRFTGIRSIPIYYQAWLPERGSRAALILVHGMGSHSGRYGNVAGRLVPNGIAVYGFDQPGHGKSGGPRGRIERFEDFTATLAAYSGMARAWQAGKPVFLFGHSAGGLVAADYLLERQEEFRGAILSAPAVRVSPQISPARILAGRILSVLAPQAGVLRLDPDLLSRDPEVVRAYRSDPLVHHGKTSARLAAELLKAMRRVGEGAGRITIPLFAFQGGAERIVHPGGAQALYDRIGSRDKTLKIYPGLYHETFNEPEREAVLADIETWVEARLGPAGRR